MADVQEIRDDALLRSEVHQALASLGAVIRDQATTIRLSVASILAGGHILLEDVPGVGKTSLARGVASVLGLAFQRIQFTSDLLPADIVGGLVLDPKSQELTFRRGPIFTSIVLADELNRASPRTQSALLEAMEEMTVSVDGFTHSLPKPFSVLATQNPLEQHGTYPLPEIQLDRFMVSLSLGYPSPADEADLLMQGVKTQHALAELATRLAPADIVAIRTSVERVTVSTAVAAYASQFLEASRVHPDVHLGASTRGGLSWLMLCRAWAWLDGRDYVTPDDLKALAEPVWRHRFVLKSLDDSLRAQAKACIDSIFGQLTPPC